MKLTSRNRDDFRVLIDRHMKAGTCYICGKKAEPEQGLHGLTGAHYECVEADRKKFLDLDKSVGKRLSDAQEALKSLERMLK